MLSNICDEAVIKMLKCHEEQIVICEGCRLKEECESVKYLDVYKEYVLRGLYND